MIKNAPAYLFVFTVTVCLAKPEHMHQQGFARDLLNKPEQIEPSAFDFSICLNSIYQQNSRGGQSTQRRQGRWAGSYDIEIDADLQRLLGIENAVFYTHAEGAWSRHDIGSTSVGSYFGVNGDFYPRNDFSIIEYWYEQAYFEDTLWLRVGKLDMTGGFECRGCPVSFDGNAYANDENTQFLNGALINNPTIPFPDYGPGAILYWNPVEHWYASVGAADSQADRRETGFNTAFHDEDYFIYMVETGITPRMDAQNGPLQGAYRFGMWYDPQPKSYFEAANLYRDDTGFYLSFDQAITKENTDIEDTQGLGTFFRYGYAPSRANDLTQFYSGGFQYKGLIEGRDNDIFGFGYAHGSFSDSADLTFTEDYESVFESYYSFVLTPCMAISPSVQYVTNPRGDESVDDAIVAGIRAHIVF